MDWKVLDLSHSFSLFLWLSTYLPIYLSIYLSIYRSIVVVVVVVVVGVVVVVVAVAVVVEVRVVKLVKLVKLISVWLFRHLHVKKSSKPSVFYTFDFEMCFAPQRRALFRHFFDIRTSKSGPRPSVFNTFDFKMCFAPQRRALFRHPNLQKWSETVQFLTLLTSKCASRHNGGHFFDIRTAKSGPRPSVFNTFDFKMCFAPQRRALFRHPNLQKWSETVSF